MRRVERTDMTRNRIPGTKQEQQAELQQWLEWYAGFREEISQGTQLRTLELREAELLERICTAFAPVRGGQGVLYLSGLACDDYLHPENVERVKGQEVRGDWRSIPWQDLLACRHGLGYVDTSEGACYLLPACMCLLMEREEDYSLLESTLSRWAERGFLARLTAGQLACTADFVNEMRLRKFLAQEECSCYNPEHNAWNILFPWESCPEGMSVARAAEAEMIAYMERHNIYPGL